MEQGQGFAQGREERRGSFRIEDVLPIVCRRIDPGQPHIGARILPGLAEGDLLPHPADEPPAEGISPQLWRLLLQIHHRLGLILKLNLDEQGITKAEPQELSLSTTGAKFATLERYAVGDLLEIKIHLPLDPPLWVVVYGKVVWTVVRGRFETAVQFLAMDASVTEVIHRYVLQRQRERS